MLFIEENAFWVKELDLTFGDKRVWREMVPCLQTSTYMQLINCCAYNFLISKAATVLFFYSSRNFPRWPVSSVQVIVETLYAHVKVQAIKDMFSFVCTL